MSMDSNLEPNEGLETFLSEEGLACDAELRAMLGPLAAMAAIPAPAPGGELAALMRQAHSAGSWQRWLLRHRPAVVGMAVLAGMGLGVTGVAASNPDTTTAISRSVATECFSWWPWWPEQAEAAKPAQGPGEGLMAVAGDRHDSLRWMANTIPLSADAADASAAAPKTAAGAGRGGTSAGLGEQNSPPPHSWSGGPDQPGAAVPQGPGNVLLRLPDQGLALVATFPVPLHERQPVAERELTAAAAAPQSEAALGAGTAKSGVAVAEQAVPQKSVSEQSVPQQSVSEQSVPQQSVSEQAVLAKAVPGTNLRVGAAGEKG